MASYLITGASRGLGLGLITALVAKPSTEVSVVFAAVRTETKEIKELAAQSSGRVVIVNMDVASEESVKQAFSQVTDNLAGKGLDVLINNAGVLPTTPGGIEAMEDLESVFRTNVTSVHYVTRAFLPLLRKGNLKKVINMSSTYGSIATAGLAMATDCPAYKVSKASLNMLNAQYAQYLKGEGFSFVAISPGWVKTELGGGDIADIDVETSVGAVLKIVFRVGKEDNGKFFDIHLPDFQNAWGQKPYQGGEAPW